MGWAEGISISTRPHLMWIWNEPISGRSFKECNSHHGSFNSVSRERMNSTLECKHIQEILSKNFMCKLNVGVGSRAGN